MRVLAGLFWLLLAGGMGLQAQVHKPAENASDDFCAGLEKETFLLVNHYRTSHFLPALEWSDSVARVARAHSRDMATGSVDFGHDGFRDRINRLSKVMTGFSGAGENVFMTSETDGLARNAMTSWVASPHHLENIRGDYNYSGLGVWQDKDGITYFTQIFMKCAPATEEAKAEPAPAITSPFNMLVAPGLRTRP